LYQNVRWVLLLLLLLLDEAAASQACVGWVPNGGLAWRRHHLPAATNKSLSFPFLLPILVAFYSLKSVDSVVFTSSSSLY
jgi:hypothetical protein